jgi:acyl carrier protein
MWRLVDFGEAAARIRAYPEVNDVAAACSPDGCRYVLVEQQGFVYGTALRDIVLDELAPDDDNVVVAVVRKIPADSVSIVELARRTAEEGRWLFVMEAPQTQQEREVAALLTELLDLKRLSMADSLPLLGADSMVLVELSAAITERFGVTVNAMDLFDVDTVRDLVDLVFSPDLAAVQS